MRKSIRILLVLAGLALVQPGLLNRAENAMGTYFAETPDPPTPPFPPSPPPGRA